MNKRKRKNDEFDDDNSDDDRGFDSKSSDAKMAKLRTNLIRSELNKRKMNQSMEINDSNLSEDEKQLAKDSKLLEPLSKRIPNLKLSSRYKNSLSCKINQKYLFLK